MRVPAELVDGTRFPHVASFLSDSPAMLMRGVRMMLSLPASESKLGVSIATEVMILDMLSGISVLLFEASLEDLKGRSNRGRRFRSLLEAYFPWDQANYDGSTADGSRLLYNVHRNPLAHSLGVQTDELRIYRGVTIQPLSDDQMNELEAGHDRPVWLGGLFHEGEEAGSGDALQLISIPFLYWALWRLLECLCADEAQMENANVLTKQIETGYSGSYGIG